MNPYKRLAGMFGAPYEPGIGRLGVLNRDEWTCKMPECRMPDRAIDRSLEPFRGGGVPDGYGAVDHIVPIGERGTPGHVWSNVRAAHTLCTSEAGGSLAHSRRRCDERLRSLLMAGETILARGAAHEQLRFGNWPDYYLLTPERLLWCPHTDPALNAELELESVTSYAEGTQSHRYALQMEHDAIERPMPDGSRHDPHAIKLVRQQETLLGFSRKDTKLAVALREQLAHHGVTRGEPLVREEVEKRDRENAFLVSDEGDLDL